MHKNFIVIVSAFLICMVVVWNLGKKEEQTTIVYHIPEGFKGCFNIYFNQPKEKELEVKDELVMITVPFHGNVLTSSASEFFADLGWLKEEAYYVNEQGEVMGEINIDDFPYGGLISNGNPLSERISRTFDPTRDQCH